MRGNLVALSLQTALALALAQPRQPSIGIQEIFRSELQLQDQVDVEGGKGVPLPKDLWESLGFYAPYMPAAPYVPPPTNCELVQVNIIQRHGSRGPSDSIHDGIKKAVHKLKHAKKYTNPALNFIKTFKNHLVEELLTNFGAAESYDAGHLAYERYASLVSEHHVPFVRASGLERVIDSSKNWIKGFSAASDGHFHIAPPLIIPEGAHSNDTLDHHQCELAHKPDNQTDAWLAVYAPSITSQFNKWAPGSKLDDEDILSLQQLCAFEVVRNHKHHQPKHPHKIPYPRTPVPLTNPVCALFDATAWAGYEYWSDLTKYYDTGYGQHDDLGAVQGVGYVNELLTRLTGDLKYVVNDQTQVNHTLDNAGSSKTFPLTRTIYADFSHDNDLVAIYSAMGLFKPAHPLSLTQADPNRVFVARKMVPFAGRMIVEKMKCSSPSESTAGSTAGSNQPDSAGDEEFVRVLVNDAVMPLQECEGVSGDGVCSLSAFVRSQSYATGKGQKDWSNCFPPTE